MQWFNLNHLIIAETNTEKIETRTENLNFYLYSEEKKLQVTLSVKLYQDSLTKTEKILKINVVENAWNHFRWMQRRNSAE